MKRPGAGIAANGQTALVTGASSGLGAEFARQLAARGHDLLLVARRRERLEALARQLSTRHAVSVEVLMADLATSAGVERVEERLEGLVGLDMLVNNAGFGFVGTFAEADVAKHVEMIHVHVLACVRLARAALPGMIARRRGAIINLSSLAAFAPFTGNVTYGATKAYLVAFSEGLQAELSGTGVKIQALCPGFTRTEFHDRPEFGAAGFSRIPGLAWMPAAAVVAGSLRALDRRQTVYVPGLLNRLLRLVAGCRPAWHLLGSLTRVR